jgi:hypothetical protein
MTAWRFLLIEDRDDIAAQVQDAANALVEQPDTATIVRCAKFADGLEQLKNARFDLLILDLKDDSVKNAAEDDVSAGLRVFSELKSIRFSPVVFYTGHAHQVRDLESPFVRIVEKTEGLEKLATEVRQALSTGLPNLSLLIEDIQRRYMWEFVSDHWREFQGPQHKADIAYLMARRLALTLEHQAPVLAREVTGPEGHPTKSEDVHPMQIYIYPTVGQIMGGDVVQGALGAGNGTWIVLTPSCDFVQKKVQRVLLARCIPLTETKEYELWKAKPDGRDERDALQALVGDNRKTLKGGEKIQPDRFKYLPGTFFLPDSLVDFQDTVSIPIKELETLKRVAALDSPFAEALIGRFARYYGRLGTPDVSKPAVLHRLDQAGQTEKKAGPTVGAN